MQQKRQTAYKIWIANLLNGQFVKQPGEWDPNFVLCGDLKVSRVNILATVISSEFAENVGNVTLDDGSATIQMRAFKEDVGSLRDVAVGDVVLVIGRPREFQGSLYITPEIIKKVENPAWMNVRKLELTKLFGQAQTVVAKQPIPVATPPEQIVVSTEGSSSTQTQTQNATTETGRQKVLSIIEKASETGISVEEAIASSKLPEEEVESIVQELLKDGEIYMPRPGQVKIV